MKIGTIVKWSFIISQITLIIGAYLKITHSLGSNSEKFLAIGIISSLIFIASAIYEIRTSTKILSSEKNIWTIALLFMSTPVGLIYFFSARNKIK